MQSIRLKITAVTIAAILTSIIALGGIAIWTLNAESNSSSVEKMNLISQNMQHVLDESLNSLQQSVDMAIYIADDTLRTLDTDLLEPQGRTAEDTAVLDAALTEHCERVLYAFSSIANNTSGIVTYYYCINSDLGSSQHGFFYSKLEEEDFVEQPPLLSTDLDPADTEHTTWYYSPINARRPIWIGPYPAHYLGERWTVSYVAPIFVGDTLIGVLGMDILFETMVEQISALRVYQTGFVSLMNEEGVILYHPEWDIGTLPEQAVPTLPHHLFQRPSSGEELIRYSAGGEQRQLSFSTLSNDMKVVVVAPVAEITANQRQLTVLMLGVTLVILLVFSVVTVMLTNAVTRPLQRLTAASQRLAAGDYEAELDYEGHDEVGILTDSFRHMRDHLKIYISDLNGRVYKDAMTGVKNKGGFNALTTRLNDAIRVSTETEHPAFAIVLFDCNGLKDINDRYGHDRGDQFLKTGCAAICQVYAHSPVFRLGGDEFAALLQHRDYEHREELLSAFDELAHQSRAKSTVPWERIDMARGMAVYTPQQDGTAEDVLRRADMRMYQHKRVCKAGRGKRIG